MLENAHRHVNHQVFHEFGNPLSVIMAGAYIPPIINAAAKIRQKVSIDGSMKASSPQDVLLFHFAVLSVILLKGEKKLPVWMIYKKRNRMSLRVQRMMTARTA